MSTQQILGVVGGIVGSFFGYPQLGFVVGSLVGAALTPKEKTEGPRLDDLKVTVSTYGGGIPTVYYNERVGGNVVWSTPKIEIATTTDSGKGGGVENTSYQYVVNMGIVLCKRPANDSDVTIRKIWRDGKLVYDASSGASLFSALASASSPYSFIELYQGADDQLPDGIEELYEGVGNVPAYRGVVRARMNLVECPGGRVPQFSFEISTSATEADPLVDTLVDFPALRESIAGAVQADGGVYNLGYDLDESAGTDVMVVISYTFDGVTQEVGRYLDDASDLVYSAMAIIGAVEPWVATMRGSSGDGYRFDVLDLATQQTQTPVTALEEYWPFLFDVGSYPLSGPRVSYEPVTETWAFVMSGAADPDNLPLVVQNGAVIEAVDPGGEVGAAVVVRSLGLLLILKAEGGFYAIAPRNLSDGSSAGADVVGPANIADTDVTASSLYVSDNSLFVQVLRGAGLMSFYRVDATTLEWTLLAEDIEVAFHDGNRPLTMYGTPDMALLGPVGDSSAGSGAYYAVRWNRVDLNPGSVASIIADQCRKAGLVDAQFDVATITDEVWGYKVTNPASARANIQPLMTAYAIDAVEEDGQVKFFKRSAIASVGTVLYEELGCVEGDAEPGDPMPLARAQEIELPRSFTVSYINPNFDYQTASETAQRQVTESQNDQSVEMSIATDPDHAASVAQMILYDAWNERNTRSFKVSRKWAYVSAGDGVTITSATGVQQLWRITKATDTGALIEWDAVSADSSIYTQTALGGAIYTGQEVEPLPPPTKFQILDIPILRDADNNAGPYVALGGFTAGYPGGELFVGDDAASLISRGVAENEATIGFAETVLGDFSWNVVDEVNPLTVNVGHLTLASVTRDVLLSNATSNVAAVGRAGRWEVIKFQRASSLGSGRYILSGLIRGERGTEWARGLHETGDVFVLLATAGLLRINSDAGSVGQTSVYTAVTKGRASGLQQSYSNTGEGLKPFSPVDLRKAPSGSDIVLTWQRRTRLTNVAFSGNLPLGEAVERYEVEIWDSAYTALKRTLEATTASATYTAAMQAADGYSSGPIYARVFQMSDSVGRGRVLEASA